MLRQIGIEPSRILPADIDETERRGEKPREICARLALEKARHIAAAHPDAYVLAADTVVSMGARALPKTQDEQAARDCLEALSGRRHHVLGGIAVIAPGGREWCRVSDTVVHFKRLNTAEIESYLQSGEWKGVAGGYAIQGRAAVFIKSIRGSYSNVVGLCLYDTMQILTGSGFFNAR